MTPLPPLSFAERREAVLSRMAGGSMLLPASGAKCRSGDSDCGSRPDSDLFYITGWREAGAIAVLQGYGTEHRFVLFVPGRDPEIERWTGPRPDPDEVKARFGADAVFPVNEFRERAPGLLAGGDRIYYRLGASPVCDEVITEALGTGRARRARKGSGAFMVVDPGAVLDAMRVRKDAAEIARLRMAARISVAAFREALAHVRPGAGEWEVEAALENGFRSRGADGPAFATIVASGSNACTLHYSANSARIGAADLVLMDAGAVFDCYAADITRTVPASGQLTGARRESYEAVCRAHRTALAACVPGATLAGVHEAAGRTIAEGLVEMGVLEGSVDEVLESGAHRVFFPHRTSHWLGLDTHDAGAFRDGDGPVRLEPGMVFTVEPGLYFPPGACAQIPELGGTGIRIEDDMLVTEEGAETLTRGLPVLLQELAPLVGTAL